MPSSACQDVINVTVSLPIRGGATVFMNVSMCESCDLVAKFTNLRLLSLLLMCTLSCQFENIFSPQCCIKVS